MNMGNNKKSDVFFHLVWTILCVIGGIFLLIRDINKTEEQIYQYTHNNGKFSKGLAIMQIQEKFGKTGVIIFDCILCFGVALISGYAFFSEYSKEKKAPEKEKTAEMIMSEIMEMFEENRSNKASEISERLGIGLFAVFLCLETLVEQGKLVKIGEDEYQRR